MNVAELYALYRRIYRDWDRVHGSPLALSMLAPVARVVAQFAEADAQNGTPLRSQEQFERCLAHGADALGPLAIRAA